MVRVASLLWMTSILAACGGGGDGGGGAPPPNGVPTVTSSGYTLNEDTQLSAKLTASDPENGAVTFAKTRDPARGQMVTFATNGAFTYRPNAGFAGTDSFAISASDGTNTVTGTITLTVRASGGANDAPSVTSASFTLVQDTQLSATLTASDPENETVRFARTSDPTHGEIVTFATNGAFTYRPNAGFVGTDSFAIAASDGTNAVTATITLTVRAGGGGGANGAPTVTSTGFALDQDTQLSETLTASDPENEPVTFAKTGDPAHGEIVTFAQNGAFTYRPDAGFVGTDSFQISASDGANTVTAPIALTVKVPGRPGSGPTVTLDFAFRQVTLSWEPVTDATFYRVLKNPGNRSSPAQIGGDLTVTTLSDTIGVHVTDWVNARYIVQACNAGGCTDSAPKFLVAAESSKAVGYFKASGADEEDRAGDRFGSLVSLSDDGNTLAVGAFLEDSAARGVNGNQRDNSATDAGAVYVFTRSGSTWEQQAYLKASNTEAGDQFGASLSLSGDGNTLAVGAVLEDSAARNVNGNQSDDSATDAGAVYVFTRSGSAWEQQAYVKASNTDARDEFGRSLSLSDDGGTLAVQAMLESSRASGVNGDQSDNSQSGSGAVYVFTRSGGAWEQEAYVKASNPEAGDNFGRSPSLSGNGDTLAVGAPGEDSTAINLNGNQNNNTARNAGAAYVFTRRGGIWEQQAYVKASNTGAGDQFGASVSLSLDGDTLAVSAPGEGSIARKVNGDQSNNSAAGAGAAYVFTRSGSIWERETYIKASNASAGDRFGQSLSLSGSGDTLAVGADREASAATGVGGDQSDDSAAEAGAAYVFTHNRDTWVQQNYVKASNTELNDSFGTSLSLSGDGSTLAVGAINDDSAATGVNGDQSDNTAFEAGAVYLY